MSIINLNDDTPAPLAGMTNCKWQADELTPRNVSVYMPVMVGDGDPSSPLAPPESGAVPAPNTGDAAAGKFLKADGTWEVPAGSGPTAPVPMSEAPAGAIDGINGVFTLSFTPNLDSLSLSLNGVLQNPGSGSPLEGGDYTISGDSITYLVAPRVGDWHLASYTY